MEGKALERAVASWIKESLPVEGKILAIAVASWIKKSCLWKVRNARRYYPCAHLTEGRSLATPVIYGRRWARHRRSRRRTSWNRRRIRWKSAGFLWSSRLASGRSRKSTTHPSSLRIGSLLPTCRAV